MKTGGGETDFFRRWRPRQGAEYRREKSRGIGTAEYPTWRKRASRRPKASGAGLMHEELSPSTTVRTSPDAGAAQRTLGHAISCVGVGRHSGVRVGLTLHPAPTDSGVRFKRSDRPGSTPLLAAPENLLVADHALIL